MHPRRKPRENIYEFAVYAQHGGHSCSIEGTWGMSCGALLNECAVYAQAWTFDSSNGTFEDFVFT